MMDCLLKVVTRVGEELLKDPAHGKYSGASVDRFACDLQSTHFSPDRIAALKQVDLPANTRHIDSRRQTAGARTNNGHPF